ncbi:hypothetical protein KOW79_008332 [Hemibagrus wyckioides]|uniref:A kinase-anchoring proteins AKAP-5 and AKAP-12 calmodulin (CaM)-binding domain-containing protein n=1 Tax=Hemibagrus wyckioides TaxID=337641 RepID=A0A9D3NST1_9TELE|nr:A-kinase anchor protein 12 [Hemibagrus wyckioides]KAG7328388.1 hypothetical protein KOW79_008332 [Hemibagrus wyckioides]
MGATLSEQQDKCEEDEEQHSGQDEEVTEDSAEDKLLQKNWKISGQNGKPENQTDEMNSQSDERDLLDVGSGFVTLNEDTSDMTDSIQEGDDSDNISKQMNNTDERSVIVNEENEVKDKVNDAEIGFKKIFRFGGFKFTLKKDKGEKIDTNEPVESEQDRNAAGPSEESWDTPDLNPVRRNEQDEEEKKIEGIGGDAGAESPETQFTENREETTPHKGLMGDVPQSPEPEEPMSPVKRFFSQGIFGSLRKKKKDEGGPKENEDELKCLNKAVEKETTKEDTTCTCLDVSNSTIAEDKNGQLYKKDESKPAAEGDIMNCLEQDKVQASPFKKLFRKLSTRRSSETKPGDTNSLDPGENSSENPQLSTELIKSQKEQETKVVETQPADEMMDTSHEESKKKSDSAVSWENLICVRSAKTRARKTSDSEDETQDKGEVHRRATESPFESSTEGDHLTSSNEQGASPAEEDSGSTWKSFKKLVTPKRRSRMEESGSVEQIQSDTEISKDESSCSLRKLISGRKKIKLDGQQEYISSDEGSKGTGTDIEDDDTPGVVPLSEYEIAEPKMLKETTDGTKRESEKEKEMQPVSEEDKPKQIQPSYNVKPLSFDAGPSGIPIPTEYMEELTEFLSKHQQLSDIPEEGLIEESVATPLSFVEWTTQYDTLAEDIVDMTADAVTAPEHASEHTEDETSEMVSAVSQLSDSPKSSGNVTPISPVHHMRECDTIFQEVVESVSMVPSVLSITTQDQVPEAQAASVSQFIVESTTTAETKVLVTHKKEEATSICIGIVCQDIRAAEVVHSLPLFEGISEITHTVPTEFVSEDLAEESKLAGIASDNVSEAEIEEIKTMLHEVLSLDKQCTILAETARKSKQVMMVENVQEEVSPVIQIEDVEDDSAKLLNGLHECTPVHAAVCSASQLLEEQIITQNSNRPETEGPLQPAVEEPVYEQQTQNTQIPSEVAKENRIPDVESSAADVEQLVQVTEVTKPVLYSVVALESDPALNQVSARTEAGVLVSDMKCSESIAPISNVIPISDSVKIEMDLEQEAQMKNDPSPHHKDSHTIQVKVKSSELQTENKNAETVPALGTTTASADAFKNIEIIREEEKTKQKIEPTSAKTIVETGDEKIVYSLEAESLSEIIDKPTEGREGKESELTTLVRESMLPLAMTSEESASKETEDMSEVILGLKKEHTEEETVHIEDCKSKHAAGDEIGMLTLNPTETVEETKKPPVISEQPRVYEEMPENGVQPPATDELIADAQTKAPGPEDDSAKSEAVKRSCVDDEPDKLLANEQEDNETANPEITTDLKTVETFKTFPEVEPQCDPDEQQTEVLISKPEMFQATESSHEPYEENNEATEAMVKMTETISTFMCEEEKRVQCNTTEQPVATRQCFNEIDRVCSLDQSVMSDTLSAEKQEDNETAKPEVKTEIITEHQEAVTGLSSAQTLSPILKNVLEKEDANITRPVIVEVTEPKLELLMITETIQHTSEVPGLDDQTIAPETETLVRTCVEKDVEAQGSVVTSLKEDTDVNSSVLRSSEAQIKTVISAVQTLEERTAADIPVIQKPTVGQLIQEPEMSMVAQEIKETKPDTDDVTTLNIPVAEVTRVEVTKQIIKGAVLTSTVAEYEITKLKEDVVSTVTTLIEEPTVASCVKLKTASEASLVETPTVVPAEVQRPTVVPVIETLAVNRAVKEVETPVTEPEVEERHHDAQAAVNIEVKHLPLTEIKVTEITEQIAGETFLKFEPQLNTEQPQKEFLSLKSEESQAPESSHKPYEENNQVTGADEISETISSAIHEKVTGVECKISDQPVKTGQGGDGEPVSAMDHVSEILAKDKAESPEGFVMSETEGSEHVLEVTKASVEVVTEHEVEMTVGFQENIVYPDATKQEEVSEIDVENAAVTEKNTERTAALKLKEESTIIKSEGQTVLTSEQVAESPIVSVNENKPEVLTHEMSKIGAETLDVAESKADINVVSEIQAEMPGVASPVETPVVISTEKTGNVEALALTSVINRLQSDLKSVNEPEVSTGSLRHETPIVVSDIQTVTGLSSAQTLSPIIKDISEKEDANINRPLIVEVTEPKLEMLIVTETIQHTSEFPVQTMETSALETETLVRTCVEKDVEAQGSVVTSLKEDTDVNSSVLRSSEAQIKTVISAVQTLEERTAADIPVIQKPTVGQLIQEPEMSMVAQEIKETKLKTLDTVDVTASKIPVAEVTRVEVTKQIIKGAVLTSTVAEYEITSLKEDVVSTVTTLIEQPTVASCVKLTTASEASLVETPTVVPAEVQRPTVVPVIETLAVNRAVKEVETPVTEPEVEERHHDAQAAVNIEVKHLPLTEIKVTEITEQVAEDVENTTNLKESKSSEEQRGRLQEVFVPVVKTVEPLPGADDDIWEDATEDIKDDHCSRTKASGGL